MKIEAGPELDFAVAKAVGIQAMVFNCPQTNQPRCHVDQYRRIRTRSDAWVTFEPSRDINDAWEAAEKVGLFERYRLGRGSDRHWEMYNIDGTFAGETGPTACTVICAAILKLKEETDD